VDLWVTVGVLLKRWYVTLPLLALVGLAAVQIGNGIVPTYSATATGRVYCPEQALDPVTGEIVDSNRFCADRASSDLAVVGAVNLNSRLTRVDVADQGLIGDYVVDDTDASLSLVYVTAEGENEDDVIATLELSMAIFESYVDGEQNDGVFKYTAGALDVPTQADSISSGKSRTQIIVVVAGLILTTVAVHIFDAALLTLQRRRDDGRDSTADEDAPRPGDDQPSSPLAAARDGEPVDQEGDWEQARKLFDDEVEKLTSDSSRWGR